MIIVFVILLAIEPDHSNIPLSPIKMGEVEYSFYLVGLFSIILVATLFAITCTIRLFLRKTKKMVSRRIYYFKTKGFDLYWIFVTATYLLVLSFALFAYWAS